MCIHHDVLRVKIGGLKVPDGNTCPLQLRSRHSIDGNSLRCCNQNTHYDTPPCEILQELTRLLVIEYLARDLHAAARPSQHTEKTFPGIHWTDDKRPGGTGISASICPEDSYQVSHFPLAGSPDEDFSVAVKGALTEISRHDPGHHLVNDYVLGVRERVDPVAPIGVDAGASQLIANCLVRGESPEWRLLHKDSHIASVQLGSLQRLNNRRVRDEIALYKNRLSRV